MTLSREADPLFLGPEFDLSLQLGPSGDDARYAAAARAVWAYPTVEGPWSVSSRVGKTRPLRLDPSELGYRFNASRFGRLTVGQAGIELPFLLSRIGELGKRPNPSDWLTLGIPVAALQICCGVDETWTLSSQPWLGPLCRALAEVADHVHRAVPFMAGVLGEEASGCWRGDGRMLASDSGQAYPPMAIMTASIVEKRGGFVVSPELWRQLAPRTEPIILSSGLLFAPPQPDAPLLGA